MEIVRLGIIGLGNIGMYHLENCLGEKTPEVVVTALAERKDERLRRAVEMAGERAVALFREGSELIEAGGCDAVLICTPHDQHPELSVQAFARGLHVLCEKPAGVSTKQVRAMNEAAERSGKAFAMMFCQRTNCLYRKLRELVQGGELGMLQRVVWIATDWFRTQYYYDSGDWRATWAGEGGGALLNQAPHNLDLLCWICGTPIRTRAFCHMGKWHDIEVEDDVTAYFELPGGATGVYIISTGEAPGTNRLEFSMEYGKIVCENGQIVVHRLDESNRTFCKTAQAGFGAPRCAVETVETDGDNPQHIGIINAFAANILHGTPLIADGREGINSLLFSNAMHLSTWLNRTVEIPFDEDLFLRELDRRRASSKRKESAGVVLSMENSCQK